MSARRITRGEVVYWAVIASLVTATLAVIACCGYVVAETDAAWNDCSDACHARQLRIDGVDIFGDRCHCVRSTVLSGGEWQQPEQGSRARVR